MKEVTLIARFPEQAVLQERHTSGTFGSGEGSTLGSGDESRVPFSARKSAHPLPRSPKYIHILSASMASIPSSIGSRVPAPTQRP